jgi:hypothetical protein
MEKRYYAAGRAGLMVNAHESPGDVKAFEAVAVTLLIYAYYYYPRSLDIWSKVVVQVVTHVETTPSVASRQLKQRMSRKHAWDAIERGTIIMAWEAVAHVDVVVEIVDSTIVNIVQESTLRIRGGNAGARFGGRRYGNGPNR